MLRKIALSSLIAFGFAGGAQAASYGSVNFGDITPEFDTFGTHAIAVGDFTFDFFFKASQPYIGSATLSDLPTVFLGTQRYNIDGLTLSLWQDVGTNIGSFDAADVSLGTFPITGDYISIQTPNVFGAGNYFFRAEGTATGTLGGRLSYTASAVAVPEPQTYAMLLAGLGAIGFLARRRRA